jgi:hypothetical protein
MKANINENMKAIMAYVKVNKMKMANHNNVIINNEIIWRNQCININENNNRNQ